MERKEKIEYYLDIAQTVAQRSTCLRRKYGAIIVKNDEVISTGYNGAPRGCTNCTDLGTCKREEMKIPAGERYELCLAGDTNIKLFDGSSEMIESLANRNVDEIEVYSIDINTGRVVPGRGVNISKTGEREDIVRVIFDDETYITCTVDHKFLMENLEYKCAGKLVAGDSVKSLLVSHKVIEVKVLNIKIPVYDISVPDYENFAIDLGNESGVFVHNCRSVHAEQNAIISAARRDMVGGTIYLSGIDAKTGKGLPKSEPCSMCKRFILNSGIEHVIMRNGKEYEVIDTSVWRLLDII